MDDEREEVNIYDAYAEITGQAVGVALDVDADPKERDKARELIKSYVEFDQKDQRESFSATLKVREMDLKDEELKMQKRKLIFDWAKLSLGILTFVGSLGYMGYAKHLDYDMQQEGYMPGCLGKWAERSTDKIVDREINQHV